MFISKSRIYLFVVIVRRRFATASGISGGIFGGGAATSGISQFKRGGNGVVRIIWGSGRAFPTTDVGPS